jgi:hypothetical protein
LEAEGRVPKSRFIVLFYFLFGSVFLCVVSSCL